MSDQEQKIDSKEIRRGEEANSQESNDFVKEAVDKDRKESANINVEARKEKNQEISLEKKAKEKIKRIKNTDSDGQENDKDKEEIEIHAEDIAQIKDAQTQIEKLIELATAKDPIIAIKVAKELDENYVLDKFHDRLMEDEVRNLLIEKGLLKEV